VEALNQALAAALSLDAVVATAAGTVVGLIFGSIPGLTFSMAPRSGCCSASTSAA
jgi:putative tricarboxylic transport membrane protein